LPLFHVGGLAILVRSAIYGIPALVHQSFDPAAANRAIDQDGVTIVSVVSAMLQRMLDERGDRPHPPALRCVLLGGGPAPRSLLEACVWRGVPVVQTYGLTEAASQVATLAPADALRKLGSAGQPLLPNELRIEREGASASAGQVGEILMRGPTVMCGYANRPEETARALQDGWLHTGDLGYLDDEGYLYVVSRRSDLIITGGENVYPA
jgi:O-succinylbenzoic acid--CoA ligase